MSEKGVPSLQLSKKKNNSLPRGTPQQTTEPAYAKNSNLEQSVKQLRERRRERHHNSQQEEYSDDKKVILQNQANKT